MIPSHKDMETRVKRNCVTISLSKKTWAVSEDRIEKKIISW